MFASSPSAGSVSFVRAIIESAEAGGAGSVIFSTLATQGDGPLVLATLTEFRQHVCDRAIFRQDGPAQFVLHNITFVPLSGCNAASLGSAAAFDGISPKRCGESYRDPQSCVYTRFTNRKLQVLRIAIGDR